jgi:hypothetical protein
VRTLDLACFTPDIDIGAVFSVILAGIGRRKSNATSLLLKAVAEATLSPPAICSATTGTNIGRSWVVIVPLLIGAQARHPYSMKVVMAGPLSLQTAFDRSSVGFVWQGNRNYSGRQRPFRSSFAQVIAAHLSIGRATTK